MLLNNARLEIVDDCYGCTGSTVIYANRDLTEKDFKKWWKNVLKRVSMYADVYAYCEENHDENRHEYAMYWFNQTLEHDPTIPF